ncbi:MAG: dimethylsulfonioproprionate lyase family protein [Geminicoccaceae bacterium]
MKVLQSQQREPFDALLAALADAFDKEGRPGGDAAAAALRTAKSHAFRDMPSTVEPGPLLEAVCKQPEALPIAALIDASRDLLSWWIWTGEGLAANVSSRLYTAELVGPDGHIDDDHVRVGLLISDAWTDYPLSSHSGEETYLVILGTAAWSIEGGPHKKHPPGTLIHDPAWTPHARRTLQEPFIGAWRWSGDLDFSSFKVDAI